jgi:D-alanyl-D-alanine carboxypeptidase
MVAPATNLQAFDPSSTRAELLSDLAKPPVLDRNTRFKYSNHGFALLGLVIEAVTNEPYAAWIRREVVAPFGLAETEPDMPLPPARPSPTATRAGRCSVAPNSSPATIR